MGASSPNDVGCEVIDRGAVRRLDPKAMRPPARVRLDWGLLSARTMNKRMACANRKTCAACIRRIW